MVRPIGVAFGFGVAVLGRGSALSNRWPAAEFRKRTMIDRACSTTGRQASVGSAANAD